MTTAINSLREQLLQGVRAWAKAVLGLSDAKVIVAGDKSNRPAMPYLAVTVLTPGSEVGSGEVRRDLGGVGGTLREFARGHRRATVRVDAFGRTASDLLEQLRLSIELPTSRTTLDAYDFSISRVLSVANGLGLRETGFEERASIDVEVVYRLETIPVAAPAAEHLSWAVTIDRTPNPPADLVVSGTEDL